ncbi:hypothetical protein CLOLEP_00071 [[Clostridium] leptum DSM 753]|jgi:hypothetical protein|uniref:Uncharacterized protein n=1 Tax=[Clostridium] leptum DSM 753 TaxID=428125 RepID=A7VNE7_9FIRM|nr:hypothetical protein CLOLEP_00071 [[Clostridium] leptum DSM 753]
MKEKNKNIMVLIKSEIWEKKILEDVAVFRGLW